MCSNREEEKSIRMDEKERLTQGRVGMYDPAYEKDACGVGFVVSIEGESSNKVLMDSKKMLVRMSHRGACGCDNNTGDGAGIMTSIPHRYLKERLAKDAQIELPPAGHYAVAVVFMPDDFVGSNQVEAEFERMLVQYGLRCVYWRTVPVDSSCIGEVYKKNFFVLGRKAGLYISSIYLFKHFLNGN